MPEPTGSDPPSASRGYVLLASVGALLIGGIVLILVLGESRPAPERPPETAPPAPPIAAEALPRTAEELRLAYATAANNRPRQIRLLSLNWAEFVQNVDAQVLTLAQAKQRCTEAVRAVLGEAPAKRIADLPDVPHPWPLFVGINWNRAKTQELPRPEIITPEVRLTVESLADGTVRLQPGSGETLNAMKLEVGRALAPLRQTYAEIEARARARTLTAENFANALQSARLLAVAASHLLPPNR